VFKRGRKAVPGQFPSKRKQHQGAGGEGRWGGVNGEALNTLPSYTISKTIQVHGEGQAGLRKKGIWSGAVCLPWDRGRRDLRERERLPRIYNTEKRKPCSLWLNNRVWTELYSSEYRSNPQTIGGGKIYRVKKVCGGGS